MSDIPTQGELNTGPRYEELLAAVERLRAALEPFARNGDAVSLGEALGHITREHLWEARRALEHKP